MSRLAAPLAALALTGGGLPSARFGRVYHEPPVDQGAATTQSQGDGAPVGSSMPVVSLSDAQFERMFGGTSTADAAQGTERAAPTAAALPAPTASGAPVLREAGPASGMDAIVVGDVAQPWERRAVGLFRAMSAETDVERAEAMSALSRQYAERTDAEAQAELRAAQQVLRDAGLNERQVRRAMSTVTPADGGYAMIPAPLAAEIFVVIEEHGLMRSLARQVPMTAAALKLDSVATKPVVYWKAEAALFEESNPTLAQKELKNGKLTALMSWTRELDEDQAIALLPLRTQLIGEGFAEAEDLAWLRGDGTSTYGGNTGLINLAGAVVVTQSSGQTTHAALTVAYLRALRDSLSLRRRRGAVFMLHPNLLSALEGTAAATAATEGTPFTRNGAGEIIAIWGHGVRVSQDMPATASAGQKYALFGNPQNSLWGQRRGFTVETSTTAIISNAAGEVLFNANQQDGVILTASERVGTNVPGAYEASFAVLKTAAS